MDKANKIKDIANSVADVSYVKSSMIPSIELYMDQVTTFASDMLGQMRRSDDEKILTKTMINNYAKNGLIPPPIKKKYNKSQILLLVMIYYYKNILSMEDIKKVLSLVENENDCADNLDMIFDIIFEKCGEQRQNTVNEIDSFIATADGLFTDERSRELAFISLLSQDICTKLSVLEKVIDAIDNN